MAIKSINAQGGDIILINNEVLDDKTLSVINQKIDDLSTNLTGSIVDVANIKDNIVSITTDVEALSTSIEILNEQIAPLETITETIIEISNDISINDQNINETSATVNALVNGKLMSADVILTANNEIRYQFNGQKKLDINGIKIGDTQNNDRFISLSSGGDFYIRNQSPAKNIVLQTYNNASIQIQSNVFLQENKTVKYTNDLTGDISDNTLVTGKYVKTKLDGKPTIDVDGTTISTLNIHTTTQADFEAATLTNNDLYLVEDISIDANNQRIINVAEPIDSTDAVTKQYADNNIGLLNNKTYLTLANSDLEQVSNILDPNITLSTIISNSTKYDNANVKYIRASINQLINKSIADKNIVLKQFAFVNRVDATNIDTETTVQLVICYWNTSLNGWRPTAYSNQFNLNTIDYNVYNLTLTHTIEKPTINSTEQLLICVLPTDELNSFINTNNILNNTNIQIGIRVNEEYGISLFGPQNSLPNLTDTPSLDIVVPIVQFYYDYKISSYAELRDLLLTDLVNINL